MRLLRAKNGARKLDVSVSTFWRYSQKEPDFPRPFQIGKNATVWDEGELDKWIESKRRAGRVPVEQGA